jgi:hypothetical protein
MGGAILQYLAWSFLFGQQATRFRFTKRHAKCFMNNQQQNPVLLKNWEYWVVAILPASLMGTNKPEVLLFFVIAIIAFPIIRRKAIENSFNTPQEKWKILTAFSVGFFFILMYLYGILSATYGF